LWHLSKFNLESNAPSEKFFRQAVDLDPTFAGGNRGLAFAQWQAAASGYQTRSLPEVRTSAEALARRAVALDGADAEARVSLAEMFLYRGDHEGPLAAGGRLTPCWRGESTANSSLKLGADSGRVMDDSGIVKRCFALEFRRKLSSLLWQPAPHSDH
jgi:hypothetical protein